MIDTTRHTDVNASIAHYLRDLAFAQSSPQQMYGYKRAATAVMALETHLSELISPDGSLPKISGVGPATTRIIHEVLATGESATVEQAIDRSERRTEIDRTRALRRHFLSRAETLRILGDPRLAGLAPVDYRGDLQMHSEWSDGRPTLEQIAEACLARGYAYSAVTDHSYGLTIAGGMSMAEAAAQHAAVARVNARLGNEFRLLRGIEANIGIDGALDLTTEEAAAFEVVLAAPHSRLRRNEDQTARLVAAVENPSVHILAHPRGRITGSRAGVVANWNVVFAAAARCGVAVEVDGDPARQDLDYTLAADALTAGCIFALDSDAHTTSQLVYAETAIAHARLAGIPPDRIVNSWELERVLAWATNRSREASH